MNKTEAIKLLVNEGWTQADAMRALEDVNFKTNPDELTIRRAISYFSGSELINRQRLQAAQKRMVTQKTKEIERNNFESAVKIDQYNQHKQEKEKLVNEMKSLISTTDTLKVKIKFLSSHNSELIEENLQLKKDNKNLVISNEKLKKDNKDLKNVVDVIRLKLAINTKQLLQYEDSEIRKELVKLFNWTLG